MDQRLPEPAVTDWRGLCEELVRELHGYASANPHHDSDALVARAREALAQPEPEVVGPSDEELDDLFTEIDQGGEPLSWLAFARAVLARFGHQPAPPAEGEVEKLVAWLREQATWFAADDPDHENYDRAADLLERQAAPVPVAVNERLPGPEDCVPHPRTKLGNWCWGFERCEVSLARSARWRLMHMETVEMEASHWLPAHALPLPSGEVE